MTTYAKLEVNPDGDILQSSYIVPGDGVLPNPQRSDPDLSSLKGYSQAVFPSYVTVALDGEESAMRITGLYFPTHVRGTEHWKLLGPIGAAAVAVYGILGLLLMENPLSQMTLTIVGTMVILVAALLVFYPSWLWFKWLYYQGAPSYRVQRRVQMKYSNLPVYHDPYLFLVDTAK